MMGLEAAIMPQQAVVAQSAGGDTWLQENAFDLQPKLRWIERRFSTEGALLNEDTFRHMAMALEFLNTTSAAPSLVIVEHNLCDEKTGNELLFELRRLTGLSWEQIAKVCEVSRRAVHFWAGGKTISRSNHKRLGDLVATMRFIDRGYGEANRGLLFTAAHDGQTFFDLLVAGEFQLVRMLAGEGVGRPDRTGSGDQNFLLEREISFGDAIAAASEDVPSEADIYNSHKPKKRRIRPRRKS